MTTEMRRAEIPENMEIYDGNYDPYHRWIEEEGIKLIRGFAFESLQEVELGPWERKGGSGLVFASHSVSIPMVSHLFEIMRCC